MTAPRLQFVLTIMGVLLSPNLFAESVSGLAIEVKELAKALDRSSQLTNASSVLMTKFGHIGSEIASDQAKDLLSELVADATAGNLPEQLQELSQSAEQAKKVVGRVDASLPEVPDVSHLDYCAQADVSAQQIADIQAEISDLSTLARDAQSFKSMLLSLENVSAALEHVFASLVGLDPLTQETTYGAFAEKWEFFWAPQSVGSSDDPNAAFLLSAARADWDVVESQANDKAQKLRTTLEARKAFHQHFYMLAEEKCADDRARAAALASLGGADAIMLTVPSSGISKGTDPCQAAERQAAAVAGSCMQQSHASMCATYTLTAKCYSLAATQCGGCGTCSSQLQAAATQARASAQQICAN